MENITFTQLSVEELRAIIRQELNAYFEANPLSAETRKPNNDFLTVEKAAEFLDLSVPTIYSKVSRRELPVMKPGKRLYFSREELKEYLKKGRRKTFDEIEQEAHTYLVKPRR